MYSYAFIWIWPPPNPSYWLYLFPVLDSTNLVSLASGLGNDTSKTTLDFFYQSSTSRQDSLGPRLSTLPMLIWKLANITIMNKPEFCRSKHLVLCASASRWRESQQPSSALNSEEPRSYGARSGGDLLWALAALAKSYGNGQITEHYLFWLVQ